MKTLITGITVALAVFGLANAQEGELKKKVASKPVKTGSTTTPVTKAEAHQVFTKVDAVCARVYKTKPGLLKIPFSPSSTAISRDEVLTALLSLVDLATPHFKYRPRDVSFDAARIRNSKAKPIALQLIRKGFVSPYGPLTTGKVDTLSIDDFGDALAFTLVGIADRSHMPSQKFSPALMRGQR